MSNNNSGVLNLPIMKHFDSDSIQTGVDKFRKGEKGIFWFLKLAAIGGLGYLTWVYILPPLFIALGQVIAVAGTLIMTVFFIAMAPVIFKGIRRITRMLHKAVIKHDPFAELEDQRIKMSANKQNFQKAKGKITQLQREMETEAKVSEERATKLQSKIVSNQGKAQQLKTKLDTMSSKMGVAAKSEDEYVHTTADLQKILSDSQRLQLQLQQSQDFVRKYGSRGNVMKKFGHKLILVETAMDNKLMDFDVTIDMLKKDYDFASKSREATETAKSALGLTTGWELEYALDVVTTTIAEDIAITTGNLKDIDTLTANFDMDSDEMFLNLDTLANEIKVGDNVTPVAKDYTSTDHRLSHEDQLQSGGFGDMF